MSARTNEYKSAKAEQSNHGTVEETAPLSWEAGMDQSAAELWKGVPEDTKYSWHLIIYSSASELFSGVRPEPLEWKQVTVMIRTVKQMVCIRRQYSMRQLRVGEWSRDTHKILKELVRKRLDNLKDKIPRSPRGKELQLLEMSNAEATQKHAPNPEARRKHDLKWKALAILVLTFIQQNKRRPSKRATNQDEKCLGIWWMNQLAAHNSQGAFAKSRKTLRSEQSETIQQILQQECTSITVAVSAANMLKHKDEPNWMTLAMRVLAFVKEHKRRPSRSATSRNEQRLGEWLMNQVVAYNTQSVRAKRRKTRSSERRETIQQILQQECTSITGASNTTEVQNRKHNTNWMALATRVMAFVKNTQSATFEISHCSRRKAFRGVVDEPGGCI